MSEQTPTSRAKERLVSADVEGFDALAELALDMRSSWNHATDRPGVAGVGSRVVGSHA